MKDDRLLADLKDALAESPENVKLRVSYGRALAGASRYREALDVILECRDRCDTAEYLVLLGETYYQTGDFKRALAVFLEALERHPRTSEIHLGLARVYRGMDNLAAARKHAGMAVKIDPSLKDSEIVRSVMKAAAAADTTASTSLFSSSDQTTATTSTGAGSTSVDSDSSDSSDTASTSRSSRYGHLRVLQLGDEVCEEEEPAVETPDVTFTDVGGMDDLQEQIRLEIVYPLTRPDLYEAFGKKYGGGFLLYGPPGCGKTYIARATAGECQATFIPLFLEDVLDMWYGESEKKLNAFFEEARKNTPAVMFIDEIEAIGGKRSRMGRSPGRTLVSQLLSELDGIKTKQKGVLVLGATNAPWDVDVALKRPGRFDKLIFVPPPDFQARIAVLQIHSRGKPLGDVDFPEIARNTEGFSGADLMALCEEAATSKLKKSLETDRIEDITTDDFLMALERMKPSTREWFDIAANYVRYGNTSGVYDELAKYMESNGIV